ncbi:MAG: zinc dependent phospholipase C family protein [Gemmatimonadales bacterium]|nr:zinc dependent phospholipase C family protein [Gemmatimonadales bacterium]MDX2057272.1 zinc dependent phospholipase C family protein [Gemmatimonadales bacterium]
MSARRIAMTGVVLAVIMMVVWPADAHAWTHGTHIFISETILANLRLLPPVVADLIGSFPYDFLYGSIAPDTSIAKKYVPTGRHSHFWNVGQETFDFAETDPLRAFGLGYLTHLAADTIAHNFFVPRQLLLTTSSRAMGHQYWELRAETHLTDRFARRARDLIRLDHRAADTHLERIISPTLFSVKTNRRIFRSLVHLSDTKSWQRAMQAARERSRFLLTDEDIERHLGLSYDFVMETLAEIGRRAGAARQFDPSGETPLRRAKRWRREALWKGGLWIPERMIEVAEERFGLPNLNIGFWESSVVERPWKLLTGGTESTSTSLIDEGAGTNG